MTLKKTQIMGILNATPDSFSDGGKFNDLETALRQIEQMTEDGADIIDIGAESSRPGSKPISVNEEIQRLTPLLSKIKSVTNCKISIDTYKHEVAQHCIKEFDVDIINDISGLRDKKMMNVIAQHRKTVVIMHMLGNPESMQDNIHYGNTIEDIYNYLSVQVAEAQNAGIQDIIIDPGIGFGKTVTDNLLILKHIKEFQEIGCPILIGTSRKSFIGKITDVEVADRLAGSIASNVIAAINGAQILRVHDVKETKQAIQIANAITNA